MGDVRGAPSLFDSVRQVEARGRGTNAARKAIKEYRVEWGEPVTREEDDARTDMYLEEAEALLQKAFPGAEIAHEIDRRTSGGSRRVTVERGEDEDGQPIAGDWKDEDAVRELMALAFEHACEAKIVL